MVQLIKKPVKSNLTTFGWISNQKVVWQLLKRLLRASYLNSNIFWSITYIGRNKGTHFFWVLSSIYPHMHAYMYASIKISWYFLLKHCKFLERHQTKLWTISKQISWRIGKVTATLEFCPSCNYNIPQKIMCGKAFGLILRGFNRIIIGVYRDRVRGDHILRLRTQDIIPMRTIHWCRILDVGWDWRVREGLKGV